MNSYHNTNIHWQAQQSRQQEISRLFNAGFTALNTFAKSIRQPQQSDQRGNVVRSAAGISAA